MDSTKEIVVESNLANLGDNLWITPLFKKRKGIVCLLNHEHSYKIAPLYKNIARVRYCDKVSPVKKTNDKTHTAQQILNAYNIKDVDCIPKIVLDEDEIEWARIFLAKYDNPIVIINDNGGSNDPNNKRAHYVCPPKSMMQDVVNSLQDYTVLQFGLTDNYYRNGYSSFTPLNNAIHIRGLDIRQLAACYHVIGKYIGGDTGDYHLMLAVGGKCVTFIPPESYNYRYIYHELLYTENLWQEEVRVKYINYNGDYDGMLEFFQPSRNN